MKMLRTRNPKPGTRNQTFVGLDIGGANLKAADAAATAVSETFEIWRAPQELAPRLQRLLDRFARVDGLAVTMTAELADCFETKNEGVKFILDAVEQGAGGKPVAVWLTSGRFATVAEARTVPRQVAAANWHALATWAGRFVPQGSAVLIDIGSTTTDVIPLRDGVPCPTGLTDIDRLLSGELVYSAARRTPVCAVADRVPLRGGQCPLAAEWFATMLDAYLILGWIPESPDDQGTANGRPATIEGASDRLARAVCCDRTELSAGELLAMAEFLAASQLGRIEAPMSRVLSRFEGPLDAAVVSGSGEFLARRVLDRGPATRGAHVISLADRLSSGVGEAACAYAVAVLAGEQRHGLG